MAKFELLIYEGPPYLKSWIESVTKARAISALSLCKFDRNCWSKNADSTRTLTL